MPEGDTIHRLANRLRPVLVGEDLRVDIDYRPRRGGRVESVEAYGKNLLIGLDDDRVLRVHLGIGGTWAPLASRKPHKLVVRTAEQAWAVGHPLHVQLVARKQLVKLIGHLGPDLLAPEVDLDAVLERVPEHGELAPVLLDQRIAAGIGNVYKSELCFQFRADPFQDIAALDLRPFYEQARAWLQANLDTPRRKTTPPRVREDLFVYGRGRRGCLRCRTPISQAMQAQRRTYWCARCQR